MNYYAKASLDHKIADLKYASAERAKAEALAQQTGLHSLVDYYTNWIKQLEQDINLLTRLL